MYKDIDRILISEDEIREKVTEIGQLISNEYKGKNLLLLGVLKGSAMFLSDLMRNITIPITVNYVGVSMSDSGKLDLFSPLPDNIKDYDIIIVKDIINSGNTMKKLSQQLLNSGANSVKICALLSKLGRGKNSFHTSYKAFAVSDEFYVGYGMDYKEKYRNLPFVGVLKKSIYEK